MSPNSARTRQNEKRSRFREAGLIARGNAEAPSNPGLQSSLHAFARRPGTRSLLKQDALFTAAWRQYLAGRLVEAEQLIRNVLTFDPRHADSLHLLGTLLKAQGRIGEAVVYYQRALILKPQHADIHANLGFALHALGKSDAATPHYQQALAVNPNQPEVHVNLGKISEDCGNLDQAMMHYRLAVGLNPALAEAYYNLGNLLRAQGRVEDAVSHYERAISLRPDYANAHLNLSVALEDQGRIDDARAHCERALAIDPGFAEAHNNLGNILKYQGKMDDALEHYGRALAIRPDFLEVHYNRAEIKTFRQSDADLHALEAMCDTADLSSGAGPHIHFALAKALEDSGDYARAFARLGSANARKRRQVQYDEASVLNLFERTAAVFHAGLFNRVPVEGSSSSVPVFVLGMPRSGTTLIEQILASHPMVHAAGERPDIARAAGNLTLSDSAARYPECISGLTDTELQQIAHDYLSRLPALADGKLRITDKAPGNFLYIGLIRLILPNARIIHTVRNPIDTCVSCYSKLFANGMDFSYDLGELGRYYRAYAGLMSHWKSVLPKNAVLDVTYENVVDNLEREARRLIEFCGLPWDDRCIDFHKASRPVKTASAVQVRKPIFRTSLQRWRRYEAALAPLLNELRPVLPLAVSA